MAKFKYLGLTPEAKEKYIADRLDAAAPKTKVPNDPFMPDYVKEELREKQRSELALRRKEIEQEASMTDKVKIVGTPKSEAYPHGLGIVFPKGKEVEVLRSSPLYEKCCALAFSATLEALDKEGKDNVKVVEKKATELARLRGARRFGLQSA